MRRFEFVGGGSAKFWEVGQSDATVTVRYGSIGAQGRTQVKELGSPAEAAAHADRLIAEKLRKGYAETTVAPSAGHTAAPAAGPAAPSPRASRTSTASSTSTSHRRWRRCWPGPPCWPS
ncbi:WGR domain-containing protein, partial [Micromonospora aurantiaca (nom. illeg.)]|uniref:WGR domain-containing protein n=1 Tax=Micromonospora aurantiaca (nom. illeg.) TaxID=47850 RepID=UPI003405FFAB